MKRFTIISLALLAAGFMSARAGEAKEIWAKEKRQGAAPLYWEDVKIGDQPTWTLEGPILGTLIYTVLREIFTLVLPVSGSWYLVTMGAIAAATMVIAPQGLWPFISRKLGIELLPIRREPPAAAPEIGGKFGVTYRNTRV